MKLTKIKIEKLANEIVEFLRKKEMLGATCIYYNNKRIRNGELEDGEFDPHDYFEYAAYNHILSMSFEGGLYDALNYHGGRIVGQFDKIFEKYGLYYELGDSWNLTAYVSRDMEVEYTYYQEPPQTIYLHYHRRSDVSAELENIMVAWYELSKQTGDIGGCTIGDGFEFEYDGNRYFMSPCSPYQGSISYETHTDTIRAMLENIGATSIHYNYGHLD